MGIQKWGGRKVWRSGLVIVLVVGALALWALSPVLLTFQPCDWIGPEFCSRWQGQDQEQEQFDEQLPGPSRGYSDEELRAQESAREVLSLPRNLDGRVAFMFLTPGELPFEEAWAEFFKGHEGRYSVYVHGSRHDGSDIENHYKTDPFFGRDIRSEAISWGGIDMIDGERRLLSHALADKTNEVFVLLSDKCVPLRHFDFVYDYLMGSPVSFLECFDDPGPHGRGRYLEGMGPEVLITDWRKGSQWFAIQRRHALILASDTLYYEKFRQFCKKGDEYKNCYPDEHYPQTLLHMMDPAGIAKWSTTYVDWSEGLWHPHEFQHSEVTRHLARRLQNVKVVERKDSNDGRKRYVHCKIRGVATPCHLFARKFNPNSLPKVLTNFPITNKPSSFWRW